MGRLLTLISTTVFCSCGSKYEKWSISVETPSHPGRHRCTIFADFTWTCPSSLQYERDFLKLTGHFSRARRHSLQGLAGPVPRLDRAVVFRRASAATILWYRRDGRRRQPPGLRCCVPGPEAVRAQTGFRLEDRFARPEMVAHA